MADGDQCGLALFKAQSAWIGVVSAGNTYTVTAVQGLAQDLNQNWATSNTGTVVGTASPKGQVYKSTCNPAWMPARTDLSKRHSCTALMANPFRSLVVPTP